MERARRRRLAEQLIARIVRSRDDLVAIVLFGSVAREEDGPDSDVDLCVVTRRGAMRRDEYFVLGGILFCVYWKSAIAVRQEMLDVAGDATRHGFLDGVALHDPTGWFVRLRREVADLPASHFRDGATKALHHMYEYVCKARNAWRTGDRGNVLYATGVVGYEARVLVALMNHRHYRSENTMTSQWREFSDLPPKFERQIEPLLGGSASVAVRYRAAMALWTNTRAWATRRGVSLRVVRSLREIRIAKTT